MADGDDPQAAYIQRVLALADNPAEEDEEEEDPEIVSLTNSEGQQVDFEFLGLIEHEGQDYALLTPAEYEAIHNAEEHEIFICRYWLDEDGAELFEDDVDEETFVAVQALAEAAFAEVEEEADELDA